MNKTILKPIYADNAATTWPKPQCVIEAMGNFFANVGASPGRSGYRMAVDSARILFETREEIAAFFGLDNSQNVIFTLNATQALNIAIRSILENGGHVVTSLFEHNSVIRPLTYLKDKGKITISFVPLDKDGKFDMSEFKESFRGDTRLVVINHASNVTGTIAPIRKIGSVCREKKVPLLVDASQTAGVIPINLKEDNIDILAFTGHKGLMGPQGTGGLCLNRGYLKSFFHGGTGSRSEQESHPDFMPDKLEAGTPNIIGIAGLGAAVKYIRDIGVDVIGNKEETLIKKLIDGLNANNKIIMYGPDREQMRLAILSFNIKDKAADVVGELLDKEFNIMTRVGLHCAPRAHKSIGTFPHGTVRVSLSFMNSEEDVDRIISAVTKIADRA